MMTLKWVRKYSVNGYKLMLSQLSTQHMQCNGYKTLSSNVTNQCNLSKISVDDIRRELTETFNKFGVSEAEESAEFIVAHAVGHKTFHTLKKTKQVGNDAIEHIKRMSQQRLAHMPVQYIVSEWDFCDITLKMRPPVLIPRPETEELVNYMVQDATVQKAQTFIEVGTGSGAICLALLKRFPKLCCIAFEKDATAVNLTLENASLLGVSDRLDLHHRPVTQDVASLSVFIREPVDFIVSNPPYIPTAEMKQLQPEIYRYEDECALHGGHDGLDVIRCILLLSRDWLKEHGSLWLEVDSEHPQHLHAIAAKHQLLYKQTILDFQRIPRFCHLQRLSNT